MKQPNAPYNAIKEIGSEVVGEGEDAGRSAVNIYFTMTRMDGLHVPRESED